MQPRSRIRGRDPPPSAPGGGGRYRRRSPPPPSPRHQRRPPPPQRRSPDRPPPPPSRYDDRPLPDISAAAQDRRSRAGVLLEAGRLAAHYLVAQGVLPVHLLRAREEPNHKPAPRHEPPAPSPATYGRKLDDQDDPRSRRDWGRGREDHDRQPRRSNWDRRSHSFDGRRNAAGDVDRASRRTPRDYEEPKRPPMSRSYSHNDRRPSTDSSRVDRRRRSRSRSRSRTRSYHTGSKRDSDWRPGGRDFDHAKDSAGAIPAAAGDGRVEEMPRERKVPSSLVVAEAADGSANPAMAVEDGESEVIPLDHAQDISEDEEGEFAEGISEDEDGEFADTHSSDKYADEMDVTQPQLSDIDVHLHPMESVEEPVRSHSQLSNTVEEMEAGSVPFDVCLIQPLGEDNGCSEVRGEMEAPLPQSEVETSVGDLNRDEQDLPAWYRMFDLCAVQAPDGCEITEIHGDPPTEHFSDSVQTDIDASQTQGKDEYAGNNSLLPDCHDLNKYDLNNEADEYAHDDTSEVQGQDEHAGDTHMLKDGHDLNRYDLNNEAVEDAQDNHLHDTDRLHPSNGQLLLNQNENGENHPASDEQQLLLDHGTDGHHVNNHEIESKVMLLPTGVCDLHGYDLNSEQTLLHDGVEKHAPDSCHLTDGQMFFDQLADGQARVCSMGNGRTIPVINLDDEYEQSDTRGFL